MKKKSFIELSCEKVGSHRSTYYRALRKLKSGKELTRKETELLTVHSSLISKAKEKLPKINLRQNAQAGDIE